MFQGPTVNSSIEQNCRLPPYSSVARQKCENTPKWLLERWYGGLLSARLGGHTVLLLQKYVGNVHFQRLPYENAEICSQQYYITV